MHTTHKTMMLGRLALATGALIVLVQAGQVPPTTAISRPPTSDYVAEPFRLTSTSPQDHHTYVYSGEAWSANAAEHRMNLLDFVRCGTGGSTNAVEHCAFPARH